MLQAASRVMTISTRIGIEQLRLREGMPKGHIKLDLLARKATDSLKDDEEEPVRHYLESCANCTRHLELARNALKSAISAQDKSADAPSPVAHVDIAKRRQRPAKKTKRSSKRHPRLTKAPGLQTPEILSRIVMLLGLGIGIFYLTRPSAETVMNEDQMARASLLPPELPPSALADQLKPQYAASARLMSNGRCADSASRLERFVEREPDNRLLRYYYSLALVCDRQASKAIGSFASLREMTGERYWGEKWWYAQALYLAGADEKAMLLLDELVENKHGRAADAEILLQRIIELN